MEIPALISGLEPTIGDGFELSGPTSSEASRSAFSQTRKRKGKHEKNAVERRHREKMQ